MPPLSTTRHRRARRSRRASAAGVALATALGAAVLAPGVSPASADPGPPPEWEITQTLTTPHASPRDLAASPDGAQLFVGYQDHSALGILDVATGSNIDKPMNAWSAEPILRVPAPDGYRILAGGTNDIYSVTPGSWDVAASSGPGIAGLAYSSQAEKVFSVDAFQLSERDPLTGELQRWASLDHENTAIAAHPSRPVVYTASSFEETVTAVDLDEIDHWDTWPCDCDDAFTEISLPSGTAPVDIAISADGSSLYVLDMEGALLVVDTATLAVTDSGELAPHSFFPSASLSINPVSGEIVAAAFTGEIVIVDPLSLAVQAIATDGGYWDTAISADGTQIFVTDNWYSTISVLERTAPDPEPATNVHATPGSRQAAVFWDPPAAPIGTPAYTVRAVGSSTPLCTTSDTFCVVTGLPAGAVQFVVTSVTDAGSIDSAASPVVTIAEPHAPASVPTPTPGATIAFAGSGSDEATVGQRIDVVASGFAPGSYVDLSLHSLPALLGSALVGPGGSATLSVVIPAGTPPGGHHLVASGFTAAGAPAAAVRALTIAAASGSGGGGGTLARTGGPSTDAPLLWATVLLATAGAALAAARIRRGAR